MIPDGSIGHCLYCQSDCFQNEACTSCPACKSLYHRECWEENRGCALFGCTMASKVEKRTDVEIPQSYWGKENKQCPKCGKEILAAAIRCRYCGARFTSERPLDRTEFNTIEMTKKRHPALKRTIVVFFIANILSCSAPLAVVVASLWYSQNRKEIASLPPFYKTLLTIGMIAGAGQTVIIIVMSILYSVFIKGNI